MPSDAFIAEHIVEPSAQAGMSVQNPYCIRYAVDGRMMARQGAMVAYRGDLTIKTQSQGVGRLIKRAVTREGLALMEVAGRGDMWLADLAKNVFILALAPGSRCRARDRSSCSPARVPGRRPRRAAASRTRSESSSAADPSRAAR